MIKVNKLLFGTAGIPISTPDRNTINGIKQVKKLGLGSMEMEFVQNVNVSKELAPKVKKTAEENDIVLTSHASYYINLNSEDKAKVHASMNRLIDSARRTHECGGYSTTFHPAFYLGMDAKKVYDSVKERMKQVMKQLDDESIDIWVRPETTGKQTAFGDLKELCKLSSEFEKVLPCIDFSHLHARSNGKENTTEEFRLQFELLEKELGKIALKNMHCHLSGINYGDKGEKNHLPLEESDMNYKDLLKIFKEFKISGVITCESPNIEEDALLLQKTYNKLK